MANGKCFTCGGKGWEECEQCHKMTCLHCLQDGKCPACRGETSVPIVQQQGTPRRNPSGRLLEEK